MRLTLTARHGKASEELTQFVESEVRRIKKYYAGIIDCEVELDYIKPSTQIAEIKITVYGQILTADEQTDDIRISIKQAVDKLERQVKKYKERLKKFDRKKAIDLIAEDSARQEAGE